MTRAFFAKCNNRYFYTAIFFLFAAAFCLKGLPGNLRPDGIGKEKIVINQPPFESSLERGRFAQIISIAEYGTVNVDAFADFLKPDLAWYNGHYYPAFPSGVSLLATPFYLLGKTFHMSQVITFSVSALFTFMTLFLVFAIGKEMNLSKTAQIFSALLFSVGSVAFVYSVTLSAHPISAAIITACGLIYLRLRKRPTILLYSALWFLVTINLFIDYPNLFILLPLVVASVITGIKGEHSHSHAKLSLSFTPFIGIIGSLLVLIVFGLYNLDHYGKPIAFTNTYNLKSLEIRGITFSYDHLSNDLFTKKSYGTRFQLSRLWQGTTVLLFSHDRGLFFYSPAFLLAGIALYKAVRKRSVPILVFAVTVLFDIIIYGAFDDPWGGWSYGPRYLIPTLPLLAVLAGAGFDTITKKIPSLKILATLLLLYGIAIAILGAITTTSIPPSVEAIPAHMKDNFLLNWEYLQNGMNSSFIYHQLYSQDISSLIYAVILFIVFSIITISLLFLTEHNHENTTN